MGYELSISYMVVLRYLQTILLLGIEEQFIPALSHPRSLHYQLPKVWRL